MALYMSGVKDDGTRDAFVSGTVTKDATVSFTKTKHTPSAKFSLAIGRKQYMNISTLGEGEATLVGASLERGDHVIVGGVYSEREYTGSDGTKKKWREVLADTICIMPHLGVTETGNTPKPVASAENAQTTPAQSQEELEFLGEYSGDEDLPF